MNSGTDRRRLVAWLAVSATLFAAPRATASAHRSLRLVVTAAVDGELDACGCRTGPQGGLARRSAFVDSLRALDAPLLLLDAGGYASTDPVVGAAVTDSLRAYMWREGVAATAIGDEELVAGLGGAGPSPPALSGNVYREAPDRLEPVGRRTLLMDVGGIRVGVTAVLSPTLVAAAGLDTLGYRALDAKEAATALADSLRRGGAELIVLLAHAPDTEVRALKWGTGFDVVVAGEGPVARRTHSSGDGVVTVYPGSRGRYVAEVLLGLDDAGIATVAGQTHGLMQGDPLRPDVHRWVLEVTREIASLRLRSKGATSDRVYRGAAACRPCHEAITDSWSISAHAGAYETLETAGLADAEECVRCHVTGFAEVPVMRPGGADLRGVQCEACHVVPDHHPEPIHVPAVEPGECRRCHDPENSPDYDPASYWRRILHE